MEVFITTTIGSLLGAFLHDFKNYGRTNCRKAIYNIVISPILGFIYYCGSRIVLGE